MHEHVLSTFDVNLVGPETEVDRYRRHVAALEAVAEAARNVVAQWRGDISRKPHIGRLREALAAVERRCEEP